jgi:carboxylesterase type B
MPVKGWSSVRSATEFGAMCAQKATFLMPGAATITSED